MRFSRVKLHNYRQHVDFEQTIDGNVVAIVGLNGAGKSNFVRALRYAVVGDVPKTNKAELLTYRESAGFVEVDIEHMDNLYTIHRGLGSESTWCRGPDGRKILGITSTNEMVGRWFGMDKTVADIVFVEQKELDNVLFADPSVREISFQKMCGIGDTNKIYRDMGPVITRHLADDPGIQAKLEAAQEQTGRLLARKKELTAQLKDLKDTAVKSTEEAVSSKIDELQSQVDYCRELSQAQRNATQVYEVLKRAREELEAAGEDPALQYDSDAMQKQGVQLKAKLDYLKARQSVQDQLDSAKAQLARTSQPDVTQEQINALVDRQTDLAGMISTLRGQSDVFRSFQQTMNKAETKDQCPLCGHETDPEHIKERLAAELQKLNAQLAKYMEGKHKLDKMIPELKHKRETALRALDQATRLVEQLTEKLTAYPDPGQADEAALSAEYKALNQQLKAHGEATHRLIQLQSSVATVERQATGAADMVAKVKTGPRSHDIPEDKLESCCASALENIGKLRKVRDTILQRQVELRNAETTLAQIETDLKNNRSVVDRLKHEVANLGLKEEIRTALEEVRDWFHYKNGPARVSKRVLESMNTDVDVFLQHLDAPFTARALGSDLTYECMFHDGRLTPADDAWSSVKDLSGAERSILGVSFRLSSYVTFAGKLGILGIDEPTSDLDTVNVRNFCNMLDKLRVVARNMDLQVLVITHHLECVDHVDSVIRIER